MKEFILGIGIVILFSCTHPAPKSGNSFVDKVVSFYDKNKANIFEVERALLNGRDSILPYFFSLEKKEEKIILNVEYCYKMKNAGGFFDSSINKYKSENPDFGKALRFDSFNVTKECLRQVEKLIKDEHVRSVVAFTNDNAICISYYSWEQDEYSLLVSSRGFTKTALNYFTKNCAYYKVNDSCYIERSISCIDRSDTLPHKWWDIF